MHKPCEICGATNYKLSLPIDIDGPAAEIICVYDIACSEVQTLKNLLLEAGHQAAKTAYAKGSAAYGAKLERMGKTRAKPHCRCSAEDASEAFADAVTSAIGDAFGKILEAPCRCWEDPDNMFDEFGPTRRERPRVRMPIDMEMLGPCPSCDAIYPDDGCAIDVSDLCPRCRATRAMDPSCECPPR